MVALSCCTLVTHTMFRLCCNSSTSSPVIIFTGNVVCCVTHWLACCSCVGLLIFVVQPTVGLWISWMKTCKVTLITSSVYSHQTIMNLLVSARHFIPDSSCQLSYCTALMKWSSILYSMSFKSEHLKDSVKTVL